VPPGNWTPMKRPGSRAGSVPASGYVSPPSGSQLERSHACEVVAEAARRLGHSSVPSAMGRQSSVPGSGRMSPNMLSARPGLARSYLSPPRRLYPDFQNQAYPMAQSQKTSANVIALLQPTTSEASKLDQQKPAAVLSNEIPRRRDGNSSPSVARLLQNDGDNSQGTNFGDMSPRGRLLGPRPDTSPAPAPWATMDDATPPDSSSRKLAQLARTCLNQKEPQNVPERQIASNGHVRPQAQSPRRSSSTSAVGQLRVSVSCPEAGSWVSTGIYSGSSGASRGRRSASNSSPQAALVNFRAEVSTAANKFGKMSDHSRFAWQDPGRAQRWR
jgi:hypothetical protein